MGIGATLLAHLTPPAFTCPLPLPVWMSWPPLLFEPGTAVSTAPNFGATTNRHVGNEFDVVLSCKVSKQYTFGFGYGYLWAGPFLKQATAHGNVSYPYSFLTYSF